MQMTSTINHCICVVNMPCVLPMYRNDHLPGIDSIHNNVGRVIIWGIWRMHHWMPKIDKNKPDALIRKPFLSQIRGELNISIVIIMSKCIKLKVYAAGFFVRYGNRITRGNTPVGVLPPRYLTRYLKTLPANSRNYIMYTGQWFH